MNHKEGERNRVRVLVPFLWMCVRGAGMAMWFCVLPPTDLSPSLSRLNWADSRHMRVGPSRLPGTRSSAIRAGNRSMFRGVPYSLETEESRDGGW